jgi:hypothetical protein
MDDLRGKRRAFLRRARGAAVFAAPCGSAIDEHGNTHLSWQN